MSLRQGKGLVLGKFMPPHRGHQALIEFAGRFCEQLHVVVGSMPGEPIAGTLRHKWVEAMAPNATVRHLHRVMPQQPEEHPNFWDVWREALKEVLGTKIDWVFASEPYGFRLAQELDAVFIPYDMERGITPISATEIRTNPALHWDYLTEVCKPYFLKKVCVFGPESTGKTTLSQALAKQFKTTWVPEYARLYLEPRQGMCRPEDMRRIAAGHQALTESRAPSARGVLVSDTDLFATHLWGQTLFQEQDPDILRSARNNQADLYLLTDIDVPWKADSVRYLPDARQSFMTACRELLTKERCSFVTLRGNHSARLDKAVQAISSLLNSDSATTIH